MYRYRGFIVPIALGLLLEPGIVFGLYALGATVMLTTTIVVIWFLFMGAATITIGEHFERKDDERGD
jgi:hypothetical protein